MAGKSPAEAVNAYLDPLTRALSCVTRGVLNVSPGGYLAELSPHALVLGNGRQRLAGGLVLGLEQAYEIVEAEGERGPWKCSTTWYAYSLDDEDGEIIAYHWHPAGDSDVTRPHAHLGPGAQVGRAGLAKAHLPTNRVSVEDFLLLGIRDLGVKPQRKDWPKILEETRETFEDWQTWPRPGRPAESSGSESS